MEAGLTLVLLTQLQDFAFQVKETLICPAVQHITSTIPALNNIAAFAGLMSIPMIILCVKLKRYLISGLLIGTIEEYS